MLDGTRVAWAAAGTMFLALALAPGVAATTLEGRVLDSETGLPIGGALIEVDADPPDGEAEAEASSGMAGTYAVEVGTPGTYRAAASHPAYFPAEETLALAGTGAVEQDFALTPRELETPTFDLYVQATCVKTQITLGGAEVSVERYASASADTPAEARAAVTDELGMVAVRGLRAGHYRFMVSRAGWESQVYPPAGLTEVTEAAALHAALKPLEGSIEIAVTGVDPAIQDYGPLEGAIVELTGLAPGSTEVVVPSRTLFTAADGVTGAAGLPFIRWRIVVKKPGYLDHLRDIDVGTGGSKVHEDVQLTLREETRLTVSLTSPYAFEPMTKGTLVKLSGLEGTNTEGIERELNASELPDGSIGVPFTWILPGSYAVSTYQNRLQCNADGLAPDTGGLAATCTFVMQTRPMTTLVEVADGEAASVAIGLEPVPAVIRGRLLAVDSLDAQCGAVVRPKAVTGLEIALHESVAELLPGDLAVLSVDTDAEGNFEARVLPGLYGFRVPSLTEYAGGGVLISAGNPAGWQNMAHEREYRGWPSPVLGPWKSMAYGYFGATDMPSGSSLAWLELHSGVDYQLDLFVVRQFQDVLMDVNIQDPFASLQILPGVSFPAPLVTLGDDPISLAGPVSKTLPLVVGVPNGAIEQLRFSGLTPGDYTLVAARPGYALSFSSTGTGTRTFTVPKWATAPGIPAATDPYVDGTFLADLGRCRYFYDQGSPEWLLGSYAEPLVSVTLTMHFWNEWKYREPQYDEPPLTYEIQNGLVTLAGAPDRLYYGPLPASGYTLYFQEWASAGWLKIEGEGPQTLEVYVGGPLDSFKDGGPPFAESYAVEVRAFLEDGREVEGVPVSVAGTLSVEGAKTVFSGDSPVTLSEPLGTPFVSDPTWTQVALGITLTNLAPPELLVRVTVRRNMTVAGKLVDATGAPIAKAPVRLSNRFGVPLLTALTDASGKYLAGIDPGSGQAPVAQTLFAEVNLPGFYPARVRVEPDLAAASADIEGADLTLKPLPPPELVSYAADRFGYFLVGVTKSGDETFYTPSPSKDVLTGSFQVVAQAKPVVYERPPFDDPDDPSAGPKGAEPVTLADEVVAATWFDARRFALAERADPAAAKPVVLPAPATGASLRALLASLGDAAAAGGTAHLVPTTRNPDTGAFEGKLRLWELPAGKLEPWAVVETRLGASALVALDPPAGTLPLEGVPLPSWAHAIAAVLGVASTLAPGLDTAPGIPKGYLAPNFKFTASIAQKAGYVSYNYAMGVGVQEGQLGPAYGIPGMGPPILGLKLAGSLSYKFDGQKGLEALTGVASVEKDLAASKPSGNMPADEHDGLHLPAMMVAQAKTVQPYVTKLTAKGTAALTIAQKLGPPPLDELLLELVTSGQLDVKVEIPLAGPVLSKIPYVGPALLLAEKMKTLIFKALFSFGAGVARKTTLRSGRPAIGTGTGTPVVDFLTTLEATEQYLLNLKIATGLGVQAGVGLLGADGDVQLQAGAPKGAPPEQTGILVEVNPLPSWPPIKRLAGALSSKGYFQVKLPGFSVKREFQIDIATWDMQLGTEGFMDLVPLHEVTTVSSPLTAGESLWSNQDGLLVGGLYGQSSIGLSPGGGALCYAETGDGVMTVMVSHAGSPWQAPVAVASAAAVLGQAVAELDDGSTLVVWSEIGAEAIGTTHPQSAVRFAVGTEAGFGLPQTLASVEGAAHELALAPTADGAVLALLVASEGALEPHRSLRTATYTGAAWGALQETVAAPALRAYSLAGDAGSETPVAVLATRDTEGAVELRTLASGAWSAAVALVASGATATAAVYEGQGAPIVAYGAGDGRLVLNLGTGASELGPGIPDAHPVEVALAAVQGDAEELMLVAWVATEDGSSVIRYAFVEGDGELFEGPTLAASASGGAWSSLYAAADASTPGAVRLIARHQAGETGSLREITFAVGQPPIPREIGPAEAGVEGSGSEEGAEGAGSGEAEPGASGAGGCGECAGGRAGASDALGTVLALALGGLWLLWRRRRVLR